MRMHALIVVKALVYLLRRRQNSTSAAAAVMGSARKGAVTMRGFAKRDVFMVSYHNHQGVEFPPVPQGQHPRWPDGGMGRVERWRGGLGFGIIPCQGFPLRV